VWTERRLKPLLHNRLYAIIQPPLPKSNRHSKFPPKPPDHTTAHHLKPLPHLHYTKLQAPLTAQKNPKSTPAGSFPPRLPAQLLDSQRCLPQAIRYATWATDHTPRRKPVWPEPEPSEVLLAGRVTGHWRQTSNQWPYVLWRLVKIYQKSTKILPIAS
jgi:hypothetical protein